MRWKAIERDGEETDWLKKNGQTPLTSADKTNTASESLASPVNSSPLTKRRGTKAMRSLNSLMSWRRGRAGGGEAPR